MCSVLVDISFSPLNKFFRNANKVIVESDHASLALSVRVEVQIIDAYYRQLVALQKQAPQYLPLRHSGQVATNKRQPLFSSVIDFFILKIDFCYRLVQPGRFCTRGRDAAHGVR